MTRKKKKFITLNENDEYSFIHFINQALKNFFFKYSNSHLLCPNKRCARKQNFCFVSNVWHTQAYNRIWSWRNHVHPVNNRRRKKTLDAPDMNAEDNCFKYFFNKTKSLQFSRCVCVCVMEFSPTNQTNKKNYVTYAMKESLEFSRWLWWIQWPSERERIKKSVMMQFIVCLFERLPGK